METPYLTNVVRDEGERRKWLRTPCTDILDCSLVTLDGGTLLRLSFTADALDIGDGGIGILTEYPLESGSVIGIRRGLGYSAGIVKWLNRGQYKFGIQFLGGFSR